MRNFLNRPQFAVDALYRAVAAGDFDGERRNLTWSRRRHALLLTSQPNGKSRAGAKKVRGTYTSKPTRAEFQFHEVLPSWNLRLDESTQGYRIYLRVADESVRWSPWFYFGSGGTSAQHPPEHPTTRSSRWGIVHIDYLELSRAATWFQYRVELESAPHASGLPVQQPVLERFFISVSNTSGDAGLYAARNAETNGFRAARAQAIRVPYRSQLDVSVPRLREKICCPTCVAMMLERAGIDKSTLDVAAEAYDAEHKIYGVWPRAAQTAANNGCEAWVQRFRTHAQVKQMLLEGQPIMASIRVGKGELNRALYSASGGHLMLLRGFRRNGDYIVNDPYSAGPKGGAIDYTEEDIGKVWLDKGGVGIIIRNPKEQ
ncbi:MAG: C39 family peptidase [Candidatus Sumerlaeaceae bacterium]